MAQSKSTKKLFNMAYGLGASIVIIGALFKILHWDLAFRMEIFTVLVLLLKQIIFAISAFEPVDDDLRLVFSISRISWRSCLRW